MDSRPTEDGTAIREEEFVLVSGQGYNFEKTIEGAYVIKKWQHPLIEKNC